MADKPRRRLVFGVDRLPESQQTAPAWPTLDSIARQRASAWHRFIHPATHDWKGKGPK